MEGASGERYRHNWGNDGDGTDVTEALMRPDCTSGTPAAASPPRSPATHGSRQTFGIGGTVPPGLSRWRREDTKVKGSPRPLALRTSYVPS